MSSILLYQDSIAFGNGHHHFTSSSHGKLFYLRWRNIFFSMILQTFFILISPLILLNSRHTHNVIFICWKLLKFVLVKSPPRLAIIISLENSNLPNSRSRQKSRIIFRKRRIIFLLGYKVILSLPTLSN